MTAFADTEEMRLALAPNRGGERVVEFRLDDASRECSRLAPLAIARFASDLRIYRRTCRCHHQAERTILDTCCCAIGATYWTTARRSRRNAGEGASMRQPSCQLEFAACSDCCPGQHAAFPMHSTLTTSYSSEHISRTLLFCRLSPPRKAGTQPQRVRDGSRSRFRVAARSCCRFVVLNNAAAQPGGKLSLRAFGSSYNVFGAAVGPVVCGGYRQTKWRMRWAFAAYTTTPLTIAMHLRWGGFPT